jgi:hypothetical protein
MPNVSEMPIRMSSHLARVSGKALNREIDRISALRYAGRISAVTAQHMVQSAPIRLAWLAQ